jgi:hypothetical protein
MTTREQLIEARKLIEKPENWAKGGRQLSEPGRECAVTALSIVTGCPAARDTDAYRRLARLARPLSVSEFNDTHSHAEALDLFDRAIEAA